MRLSIRSLTLTAGLLWGGAILLLGIIHLASPGYGSAFLEGISSIYIGFHGGRSAADVLLGTVYALIDGALGGLFFGWLYNSFARTPAMQKPALQNADQELRSRRSSAASE
jgi:hypothetical protein